MAARKQLKVAVVGMSTKSKIKSARQVAGTTSEGISGLEGMKVLSGGEVKLALTTSRCHAGKEQHPPGRSWSATATPACLEMDCFASLNPGLQLRSKSWWICLGDRWVLFCFFAVNHSKNYICVQDSCDSGRGAGRTWAESLMPTRFFPRIWELDLNYRRRKGQMQPAARS